MIVEILKLGEVSSPWESNGTGNYNKKSKGLHLNFTKGKMLVFAQPGSR